MARQRLSTLLIVLVIIGCAKRGSISGGLKDTIAPTLRMSFPKNYSTDFNSKTFKLTFSEYVKLKNINKQLIISPPMKNQPEIGPTVAGKDVIVKIKDTLLPNTTYSFNFGQSIEDNNEGNPYRQFKYVFSTGAYIDSLALRGKIKDSYNRRPDNFVSVLLYEIDDSYTDSVIYKNIPRYITNTLDSARTFKLENLKAGKYMLAAIKDANNNFKFDPQTEKIGFRKQYVTVPNDTLFELELFKETPAFKAVKPVQASGNRLLVGYEGYPENTRVTLQKTHENLPLIITKFPKKDSLQIWYQPIKLDASLKTDSLSVSISNFKYLQNYTVRIKNQKVDTLSFSPNFNGNLPLRETFAVTSSVPLKKFDASKMAITKKDSASVAFTTEYDEMKQQLSFKFKAEPLEKYKISLLPGAVLDYLERPNDTLNYRLETKNTSDFGNLRINLENVRQFPVIVELTDAKGEMLYSKYSESSAQIDFNLVNPALFTVRVIYDENKNGRWDSGNFLEKRQPEEVIYFPKEIDVRANWDVEQAFNLTR